MTTMFKHFDSHQAPSTINTPRSFTITPAMQTIVVDRVTVIDPELASVIRYDAETIIATPEESHSSCPTHGKMISCSEAWPITTCVPVVDGMAPTTQVRPAATETWASTTLTEIKCILSE
jgi:hypothetical protein